MKHRWLQVLHLRLRSLFRRGQVERELEEELQFHLEQDRDEARERGMTLHEAESRARKRLGGMARIQEECRDMRRTNFVERPQQDVRYACECWRTALDSRW